MKHIHFDAISSTQDHLIENCNDYTKDFLVSAKHQSHGRGRSINKWDSYENSLAFSFTLKPAEVLTLTSLEIALLIIKYVKNDSIKLKWPNDILTSDYKKCGGILIQLINNTAIVGVGLNWGKSADRTDQAYKTQKGVLSSELKLTDTDFEDLPMNIYNYILSHRMSSLEIINQWNENCVHLGKQVSIIDGKDEQKGLFKGIGPAGEAILEIDTKEIKIFSGSLIIN